MYLIAILLLLFIVDEDIKAHSELLWFFGIAGVELVRELWVGFIHIYEHLLSKALILV
jgi:hypothetical protein